jgi:hypothetical protein
VTEPTVTEGFGVDEGEEPVVVVLPPQAAATTATTSIAAADQNLHLRTIVPLP